MWASAWAASCSPIWADRALICSVRVVRTASRARVMWALALAVVAGGAAGRGGQAGVQDGGVGAAAVADAGQPGGQARGVSQSARSWESKRARNARLIGESSSANRPTAPGKALRRWARSWLATATRWLTRSLRARQARRSATVAGLSGVRGAAGPGRCAACRPARTRRTGRPCCRPSRTAAQVLDLVRADHHHGDPGPEQGIDDRAVGALDRDLPGAGAGQDGGQLAQARGAVLDRAPAGSPGRGHRRPTPRDHRGPSRCQRSRRRLVPRAG